MPAGSAAPPLVVPTPVLHRGGEPVFQIGIEAVLRLAGLQIEKAENQRAGKPEQR